MDASNNENVGCGEWRGSLGKSGSERGREAKAISFSALRAYRGIWRVCRGRRTTGFAAGAK